MSILSFFSDYGISENSRVCACCAYVLFICCMCMFLCVCVCMCTYMYACVCVCVICLCVSMYVSVCMLYVYVCCGGYWVRMCVLCVGVSVHVYMCENHSRCCSSELCAFILRESLLLAWKSRSRLEQLDSALAQGSSCLYLASLGITRWFGHTSLSDCLYICRL